MSNIESEYRSFKEAVVEKSVITVENKWEYLVSGNGTKTLLVLNGGLRVSESAFKYVTLFNKEFKVIVPTYPPLTSINKMIDGINEIIKTECNEKPYVFCQSYGGMIGECLIQKYPEVTDKIIFSGTSPLIATRIQFLQLEIRAMLIALLPASIVAKIYKKNLLKVITYPLDEKDFWVDLLNGLFDNRLNKKDAFSHFKTSIDALKKFSFINHKNSYKGEVLLLRGEMDCLINDDDIRLLQKYYASVSMEIIPNAGHTSAFENPEAFYNAVMDFCKKRDK